MQQMAIHERSNFFRVILPCMLQKRCLELPSNYVNEYCELLCNAVDLEVPTGEVSKMEVKRSGGRAWLHTGWQNFVERYSIECGYFLVFIYEGGSGFRVRIFDRTTKEIKYPLSQVKEEEDDVEILNEFPPASTGGGMKRNKSSQVILHFSVILQRTYISDTYLYIPEHPASSYLRKRGSSMIRIVGEDGREWFMKCEAGPPPLNRVKFKSGWAQFVQQNGLRQGYKCGFDLVSENPMTFKVHISRVAAPTAGASTACKPFKSKKPHFVIRMSSYYVSSTTPNVHIPSAYSKRYLHNYSKRGGDVMTLHGSNGRTWSVHCYCSVRNTGVKSLSFTKGWKVFVSQNRLRVGDLLVFEMIKAESMAYKFTITRS